MKEVVVDEIHKWGLSVMHRDNATARKRAHGSLVTFLGPRTKYYRFFAVRVYRIYWNDHQCEVWAIAKRSVNKRLAAIADLADVVEL